LVAFLFVAGSISFFFSKLKTLTESQTQMIADAKVREVKYEQLSYIMSFAASAAHQCNTPLASIQLIAEEAIAHIDSNLVPVELLEDLNLIIEQVKICSGFIKKLRTSAGDLEGSTPQIIDGSILIQELLQSFSREERVRISALKNEEKIIFVSQTEALLEVLRLLVKNGLESKIDAHVMIETLYTTDEKIQFIVQDTGTGIPAHILEKVGEPFFTTKQEINGLGLGVFLAKIFCERLGGNLSYESTESGTKALLEIPKNGY
jgi:signal transduction histidine kinase